MGKKIKILYIAGYSRSGSTILDIVLSSHPKVFGTGELAYLFDDWHLPNRKCTCGQQYRQCAFWGGLLNGDESPEALVATLRAVEHRKYLKYLITNKLKATDVLAYQKLQNRLFDYISKKSDCEVIVDSSKSSRDMAGRFWALSQYIDYEVYVVHLVKDGWAVANSYLEKGRNWAMEGHSAGSRNWLPVMRAAMGWRLANAIAMRVGECLPQGHYMRLRYEDFIENPALAIAAIGKMLNVDFEEVIKKIQAEEPFTAAHNVGGNRLRLQPNIKLQKSNKTERSNKKKLLSLRNRVLFEVIGGKIRRKLGY